MLNSAIVEGTATPKLMEAGLVIPCANSLVTSPAASQRMLVIPRLTPFSFLRVAIRLTKVGPDDGLASHSAHSGP